MGFGKTSFDSESGDTLDDFETEDPMQKMVISADS